MNILHLIESSEQGGAESIVLLLCKAFREKGTNCVIGLLQSGWLEHRLREEGFTTVFIEHKTPYDFACLQNLRNVLVKHKIDIVHSHEFMMNTYGSIVGLLTLVPVISTVHGRNYYWEKRRRRIAYRFVAWASKMVAVSDELTDFLVKRVGIPRVKMTRIYNGIDCSKFTLAASQKGNESLKDSLSIPLSSQVVGTVGMLSPVKNHLSLLKAASIVMKEDPETVFAIVGEGELLEQLQTVASELGIREKVIFTGLRNDVLRLIELFDVYACSSISEGISLSILEAMASGKPVVATRVGGNPEIVSDGVTGFLVPARDPEQMASKMLALLRNRRLAKQFGEEGRRTTYENFNLNKMADSYQKIYESALIRRNRRAYNVTRDPSRTI